MISLKRHTGAKIVGYSVMTLSVMALAGLPILYIFSQFQDLEFPSFNIGFALTIFIGAFGFLSAKLFLKKKSWSRWSLLLTCILYLITFSHEVITAYLLHGDYKLFAIIPMCLSIYGVLYLLSRKSKDWLSS